MRRLLIPMHYYVNIADTWYEVVMDLGGSDGIVDFNYTGYDFKNMKSFR